MAKLIGLDVGTKRIGVAKANSDVRIAVPIETVSVDGKELDRIAQIARLNGANIFVVGLPRNSKGEETAQSSYSRTFAKKLKAKIPNAKVCFQDESLTSVEAESRLQSKKSGYAKGDIDAEAACIILQDFLERLTKDVLKPKTEVEPEDTKKKSDKPAKKPKSLKKFFRKHPYALAGIIAGLCLIFAGFGAFAWYKNSLRPAGCANDTCEKVVKLKIVSGETSDVIAGHLKERQLIKSPLAFKIYLFLHGHSGDLKAGDYEIIRGSTAEEIAQILIDGSAGANVFRLTILPGETIMGIKDKLLGFGYDMVEIRDTLDGSTIEHPVLVDKPKNSSLEGYMYGDTYEFYVGEDLKKIVTTILDQLYKVVEKNDLINKFAAQGLNLHEGITLASIVQKEAKSDDQPIVAQVFMSRLASGIKLGSDVTATYAADQVDPYRNKYSSNQAVLNIDSCYNTRRNFGLPCGPISNPGESALNAVANPADTTYLYFLTGDDGKMYYSYTDAEHVQNVSKYCKKLCKTSL